MTDYYAPEAEDGLSWRDPAIGIDWPITADEIVTNARDQAWPPLADLRPL